MNLLDIILIIVLAVLFAAALRRCISGRRTGGCSCGCSSCPEKGCAKRSQRSGPPEI